MYRSYFSINELTITMISANQGWLVQSGGTGWWIISR